MGKIFISKNTKIEINELRSQGMSDQDIFNQLSDKYYEKDELSRAIYYTIKPQNFENIKYYYFSLVALTMIILFIRNLWSVYINETYFLFGIPLSIFSEVSQIASLITIFMLNVYRPPYSTFLTVMFLYISLYLVNISFKIYEFGAINYLSGIPHIISLIFTLIICYLCYKIMKIGFPNYKIKDIYQVPKNNNGEYIFD